MKYEIGSLVQLYNHEHIWHGETAIVRDVHYGFYRIEIHNNLTWVPEHWLVEVEDEQIEHQ